MTAPLSRIYETAADAVKPDPIMLVSEWAADRLELPKDSPEPGRWKRARAPYMVEPMDRLSRQDPCELLVAKMASQLGKTLCLLLAPIGHHIDTSPRSILYVQPTIETVEEHAKKRVQPMFDDCPTLAAKVPRAKSRGGGNTLKLKEFPGGFIKFAGANSAASLASTPIGDAFCDEIDRWPEDCDGEGDPRQLVRARQTNYRNAKLVLTSTPTETDHSPIDAEYLLTDQNQRWVPCPHCGAFQVLHWRDEDGPTKGTYRLRWDKGKPEGAYYLCEHCDGHIEDRHKAWMDLRGEWRPKCPDRSRGGKIRGYELNVMLSPWFSWEKLAAEWEAINGDPAKLRGFVNTRLAQTFSSTIGGALKAEGLLARREDYLTPSRRIGVITAGCDVQHDRIEVTFVGWDAYYESWAIDHVILPGSPAEDAVWEALDAHLLRRFTTEDGRTLIVAGACVDAGDGNFSDRVVSWCAPRHGRNVWATKGSSTPSCQIWPKKPSKITRESAKKAKGLPFYVVGVFQCKREIMDRLMRDGKASPGPGAMHFPERWPSGVEVDESYFAQLTCEKLIRKGGKPRWTPRHEGARNEALDCFVYSYAALHGLIRLGLNLPRAVAPAAPVMALDVPSPAPAVPREPAPVLPPPRSPGRPVARPAPRKPGGYVWGSKPRRDW